MRQTLISMGIDVKDDGEYKVKCVRRKRQTIAPAIDYKKRRMMMSQTTPKIRMLLRRTSNATNDEVVAAAVAGSEGETNPVYGDPVMDPGEEVRFSVEVCKIKNLPGLYIVDVRRMRGNVWSYKFLYHAVLDALDLGSKGGYMSTRAPNASNPNNTMLQPHTPQQQKNHHRASTASSSNGSSSVVLEEEIMSP